MSKDRLQEIKGKVLVRHVFIQPYQMSDDGREDFEEDVQWLISQIEGLGEGMQILLKQYQESVSKADRLEEALKEIKERSIGFARIRAKQALETEGEE
jgi:hypothetical protein